MGKVILCAGKQAAKAWQMPDGIKVYSVEELCYYIYQNIYGIGPDFYSRDLTDWLEQECRLPDTAEKLRWLQDEGYGVKDMTVALLCSTDYYTEAEIIELIRKMNELEKMPDWKRRKRVADEYMKKRLYSRAKNEYEKILAECEMTEEERGQVLHNSGIARLYLTSLTDAAESFYLAYRIGHHQESLKLCLLAYRMGGCQAEYQKVKATEAVSGEFLRLMEEEWNRAAAEADQTEQMQMINKIILEKQGGMVAEACEDMSGILEGWKKKYRDSIMR